MIISDNVSDYAALVIRNDSYGSFNLSYSRF